MARSSGNGKRSLRSIDGVGVTQGTLASGQGLTSLGRALGSAHLRADLICSEIVEAIDPFESGTPLSRLSIRTFERHRLPRPSRRSYTAPQTASSLKTMSFSPAESADN